ncbi:DUF4160 domain-containing protein [bacterium]|nr:DUF4160 domain-containing protein [bacterium]
MPTISAFYGILIRMFFNDHAPPHFHVQYAEFKATVDIHQQELLEDWQLCMDKQQPKQIEPLK